jgi:hypothetical protein
MADRPEIAEGVIRALCGRIRLDLFRTPRLLEDPDPLVLLLTEELSGENE